MTSRALPLVGWVLVALASGTRADDDGEARIPFTDPAPDETNAYGLYHGREKVGWATLSLWRSPVDGAPCYVSESAFQAEVAGAVVGAVDFASRDVFEAVPPYGLLEGRERMTDAAGTRETVLRREGQAWAGTVTENGVARAVRLGRTPYSLVDRLTHVQWMRSRPSPGQEIRVRELDLARLVPDVYTYRIVAPLHLVSTSLGSEASVVALTSLHRGALGEAWIDPLGRVLQAPVGEVLEMRLESARQAREPAWASELGAFGRAPAVHKLGEPASVARVVLAVFGRSVERVPSSPRRTVAWDAATQEALWTVVDRAEGPPVTPEEARSAGVADELPGLLPLARRATGDAAGPRAQVERILAFTAGFLRPALAPHEPPVAELLGEPWGDATEYARLFVALARTVGIPARTVRGLVYLGDHVQMFGPHAWAEVVLDGRWVEVDPAWGQARVDATHLDLARGDADLTPLGSETRHLAFEVREIERRAP